MKSYQSCLCSWYCCITALQITEDVMGLKGAFQVFGIIQPLHVTEEETIITPTNRERIFTMMSSIRVAKSRWKLQVQWKAISETWEFMGYIFYPDSKHDP